MFHLLDHTVWLGGVFAAVDVVILAGGIEGDGKPSLVEHQLGDVDGVVLDQQWLIFFVVSVVTRDEVWRCLLYTSPSPRD